MAGGKAFMAARTLPRSRPLCERVTADHKKVCVLFWFFWFVFCFWGIFLFNTFSNPLCVVVCARGRCAGDADGGAGGLSGYANTHTNKQNKQTKQDKTKHANEQTNQNKTSPSKQKKKTTPHTPTRTLGGGVDHHSHQCTALEIQ